MSLLPTPERFWSKVDKTSPSGCWLWTGATVAYGAYGCLTVGSKANGTRRTALAHRVSYELAVGPIPAGLTIDHLCRTTLCVNPSHLDAVTMGENTARGTAPSAVAVRTNRCHNGHPFDEANTYVHPASGRRKCRACAAQRQRRYDRAV